MSDTLNNHVVSKVILNGFSPAEAPNNVFMSTLNERGWSRVAKPMPTSVAGTVKDIYSIIKNNSVDRRTLEQKFNNAFEGSWQAVIGSLEEFPFFSFSKCVFNRNEVFPTSIANTLIKFIHYQYKKSPRMREIAYRENDKQGAKFWKKIQRNLSKNMPIDEVKKVFTHMSYTSFLHQSHFRDTGIVEQTISAYDWRIWCNLTNTPFVTSDTAVLWFNEIKRGDISTLYAPLSSKYAIEIQSNFTRTQKIFLNCIEEEDVKKFNHIMGKCAFQRVFCSKQETLQALVDEMNQARNTRKT